METNLNHYMKKSEITRSLVEGTPGIAMCDEPIQAHSELGRDGKLSQEDLPICPACELLYGALGERAEPSGAASQVWKFPRPSDG